jgi:carbon monoxide dehydrogenase subunit G
MPSVSSEVTINQPVEKVFGYIVDVNNHKAWQAGILEATISPAGPPALGSIYQYTSDVMGRKIKTAMQISAFEHNRKWAIKTSGVPTPVETVYEFEPAGAGTKLTVSMELTGGYPKVAEGMVKQQMKKSMDEQAARIKQYME